IEKPPTSLTSAIESEGWTDGSYDANANAPHATAKFGTPVFYYASSIDGEYTTGAPRGENAGEYFVRAYVPGTDNYLEFALTDGNAVSFRISPVRVALPTLNIISEGEGKNDTYAAADLSASINGFNATLMSINYDGRIAIAGNDVEVFARNAGTYTVTIAFNDSVNYVWAWDGDAAVMNNSVVTLDWTIVKKQIAMPTANESLFIVNGGVLVYIPEGFDAEIMDISGNEQGYGGEFAVVVTLKDLSNYEWIGGTNGAVEFTWQIVGVNTVFAVIVGVLSGGCGLAVAAAVTQGVLLRKRRLADEQGPKDDTAEPEQQDAQSINELEEEEKFND
ncbi:MAG: hypothetical protein K2L87_01835, partial [Clostridiales bacterium]|nr:hypothetical protein [Clostridiales bacterium]